MQNPQWNRIAPASMPGPDEEVWMGVNVDGQDVVVQCLGATVATSHGSMFTHWMPRIPIPVVEGVKP